MNNETWDAEALAKEMLETLPRLSRLMVIYITSLTDNEITMMQISVMYMLMKEKMTTSELAKRRKVSLQAASTLVQGLVDRGLVMRVEDPTDRRRSILELTEEGQEQHEQIRMQMIEHLSELVSDLNEDETSAAQVFLGGLQRIIQKLHLESLEAL